MNISLESVIKPMPSEQNIEIVERKGSGHPDSLTDGICEAGSRALCKFYREKEGTIHHHNLDKGLLIGGVSNPVFGGGEIVEPPTAIVAGTATIFGNIDDVKMVIYEEAEEFLHSVLRFNSKLNPTIEVKIHPGSTDIVATYNRYGKGETPLSNDTSFGVGFAPRTKLEDIVYNTERALNSDDVKKRLPWIGEDIKVMGIRRGENNNITVAVAFVSKFISSLDEYYEGKEKIKDLLKRKFGENINFSINTADHEGSIYLTVSGTSWENGDDGQVGRGNRSNGLITPTRTMSLEAVAGKNPVAHIGKLYNLKAQEIADEILKAFDVKDVEVFLVSQIGKPVNQPFVGVKYIPNAELKEKEVSDIVADALSAEGFNKLTEKLVKNKIPIC